MRYTFHLTHRLPWATLCLAGLSWTPASLANECQDAAGAVPQSASSPSPTPSPSASPTPSPTPTATATPTLVSEAQLLAREGRSTTVHVDLTTGQAEPSVLTVNIQKGDAIAIDISTPGAEDDVVTEVTVAGAPKAHDIPGTRLILSFLDCGSTFVRERMPLAKTTQLCPAYIQLTGAHGAVIYAESSKDRTVAFLRIADKKGQGKAASIVVRLVKRGWELSFSTGLAGFAHRDHRYVLAPATGGVTIERASDGEIPYSIATFAHYDRTTRFPFAISAGFATKVPIEDVTLLIGLSAKARTLPLVKSGYLTVGYALTKLGRLAPDYESRYPAKAVLPATTTLSSLVEKRRDWNLFLAFTFAFAGGGEGEFTKKAAGQ